MLPVGLAAFGVAGIVGWCAGLTGLPRRVADTAAAAAWLLAAVGAAALVLAGAAAVAGHPQELIVPLTDAAGGDSPLLVDPLAGLFLLISFGVAVPITLAGTAGAAARPRLGAAAAVALAAVALVITAGTVFVFLFGWELLTLAFYLLTVCERDQPGTARAAVVTGLFGKASGGFVLLGALLAAASAGSTRLADLGGADPGVARPVAYTLLVVGFAIKVGLVPVQVWLPRGYAAAPGPARAIMAGAAVNVGFYGLWRTLQLLGAPPVWLVVALLLVAGASAVWGIVHAAVHADLRYQIAWSSVENAGVITAGYAAALAGAAGGQRLLVAAGLLAATMQVIAHALGKSLLFVAAAAVERAAGTTDLDRLRGVARRLPWAGTGLVVGSLTLAGLPLTAGFAAEWLTLEALMQQFRIDDLPLQLAMATSGALVALSIGIAGFTFVRLVALTAFGGPAPTIGADRAAADRPPGHRAGIAVLSVGCLAAAAAAPALVRLLAAGLAPIAGEDTAGALAGSWVLQPVYPDFSALSPTWLWIVLPAMAAVVIALAAGLGGSRLWRVRVVPAWNSASPGVERGVGYTSFGFAHPVRKVLANLLRTRGRLHQDPLPAPAGPDGPMDGPASRDRTAAALQLGYTVDVDEVIETRLYRPAGRAVRFLARQTTRLQSGRLDAYLAYMLVAVIAVLAVVTALS